MFCRLCGVQLTNVVSRSRLVTCSITARSYLSTINSQETSWIKLLYQENNESAVKDLKKKLNVALISKRSHERGDLMPYRVAQQLVSFYSDLHSQEDKGKFFTLLSENLGNDNDDISHHLNKLQDALRRDGNLHQHKLNMTSSLTPAYKHLFDDISKLQNGVGFLVNMRKDLLILYKKRILQKTPSLIAFDTYLKEHLAVWFANGFLDLNTVSWENTTGHLLEKIMKYEAVHAMNSYEDLKIRAGLGRRVFTFTHRLMPGEPLVILHTLLGNNVPNSIQSVLDTRVDVEDKENIKSATFYSISSSQRGLDGIGLGNLLIKRVVELLQNNFDKLDTFVTLSPVPGFRKWLDFQFMCMEQSEELASTLIGSLEFDLRHVKSLLSTEDWHTNKKICDELQLPFTQLCARYLLYERRRGFALDPVAHFHLRNGASLWRLNWLGNTNTHGLNTSYGLMVNYKYDLSQIEFNNNNYVMNGEIAYSELVKPFL